MLKQASDDTRSIWMFSQLLDEIYQRYDCTSKYRARDVQLRGRRQVQVRTRLDLSGVILGSIVQRVLRDPILTRNWEFLH